MTKKALIPCYHSICLLSHSARSLFLPINFLFGWLFVCCSTFAQDFEQKHAESIKPFVTKYCVHCHGGTEPKGDLNLADLSAELKTDEQLTSWESVLDMVEAGEMPPQEARQPSKAERKMVTQFISDGLKKAVDKSNNQNSQEDNLLLSSARR